jgi:hypothetical protein
MMDVRNGWVRQLKQGRLRSICGAVKLSGDGLGTCWTGLDHRRDSVGRDVTKMAAM